MSKTPTPEEINRANKDYWDEAEPRFKRLIEKLPGTLNRAIESQGHMPVECQLSLEHRMFEAQKTIDEQNKGNSAHAARSLRLSRREATKPQRDRVKELGHRYQATNAPHELTGLIRNRMSRDYAEDSHNRPPVPSSKTIRSWLREAKIIPPANKKGT